MRTLAPAFALGLALLTGCAPIPIDDDSTFAVAPELADHYPDIDAAFAYWHEHAGTTWKRADNGIPIYASNLSSMPALARTEWYGIGELRIRVDPAMIAREPQAPLLWTSVIAHELGHCLGLTHTTGLMAPHPIPGHYLDMSPDMQVQCLGVCNPQ